MNDPYAQGYGIDFIWVGRPARVKVHGKKQEHRPNSYDFDEDA